MNNLFKVKFYLRAKENKDGKRSILTRLYYRSERIILPSTGLFAATKSWDCNKCRVIGKSADAKKINDELDKIEADLTYLFNRYKYEESFSLNFLKAKYLGTDENPTSFMDFFDKCIDNMRKEVEITRGSASLGKFVLLRNRFADFIYKKYNRRDFSMSELSYKVIVEFEHYLSTETNCARNSVMFKIRNLKTLIIRALKLGLLKQDPFANYKIRFQKVDRGFLTESEINLLMTKTFCTKRLEQVRDIFVFSCFTGLAYIDVRNLQKSNIVELDGRLWIMTKRHKTNVPTNVMLLDIPKKILDKYADAMADDEKNRLLPILSNQKMNAYLKEIADLCGIEKRLSFHLARHTFATMALTKGVPVESVSKMLGHTNILRTDPLKNHLIQLPSSCSSVPMMNFALTTLKRKRGTPFSSVMPSPRKKLSRSITRTLYKQPICLSPSSHEPTTYCESIDVG